MFWDPTFIILIPAIILAAYAQFLVSSRFSQYSKVRSTFGFNGTQLARQLLDNAGLYDIKIERIRGNLTDHYDPKKRVVRLSDATHNSTSIAALGVVAHEIGHAIQDKEIAGHFRANIYSWHPCFDGCIGEHIKEALKYATMLLRRFSWIDG